MHSWLIKHIDKRLKYSTGVEIVIEKEQSLTFFTTKICKQGDELEILEKKSFIDQELLPSVISSNSACYLSIDGKGILHKRIDIDVKDKSLEVLAHELFPGIKVDDFFIQLFKISEGLHFLSLIRKELFNKVIEVFHSYGLFPATILLGPFSVYLLKNTTDLTEVVTQLYSVKFLGNDFSFSQNNVDEYINTIEQEKIEKESILSYTNSIIKYTGSGNYISSFDTIQNGSRDEFYYKIITKPLLISIISVLFIVLVSNFLIQSGVRNDNKQLSYLFKKDEEKIKEIEKLHESIKQKELFVKQNNLSHTSKVTFYIDRIAKLRPEGIFFQNLTAFPLASKFGEIDPDNFNNNNIFITGQGGSSMVNQFLIKLREEEWIEDVDMEHYENKNTSQKGVFRIVIRVVE